MYGINGKQVSYRVEAKIGDGPWAGFGQYGWEQNMDVEPAVESSYDNGQDAIWAGVNVRPFYSEVRVVKVVEELIALPPVQHAVVKPIDPEFAACGIFGPCMVSGSAMPRDYEGRN